MASIPCVLIALLICLSQDHMGVQGEIPTVFSSVGGNVTLPCSNVVYSDCSSTTWVYSILGWESSEGLFTLGEDPAVATHRAKRLSLVSDCSLHITDVTTEDAGRYTCQQYLQGGPQHGEGADVHLSVLQVSASPSETEMEAGSHVTLYCLLHTRDYCGRSVADKGVSLSWVDETGKDLQITTTPPCSITLTEELRGPNPFHTRTCQLTAGGQVQTSVSHTIRVKGVQPTTSSPRMKTASSTSTSGPSVSPAVPLVSRVVVSVSVLAAALMIIVVICKRRTNAGGEPRHQSTQSRTSAIVMLSVQPPDSSANKEEGADLHYAAFQHLNPTQAGPSAKQSEDNVTYSTIMQLSGGEDQNNARPAGRPVDPNDLYANVQKNNNIQN